MTQEQSPAGQPRGSEGGVGRFVGAVVGTAVTAVAAKFGAADFARDAFTSAWNIDYSDNVRDAGMAITAAAGTGYALASLLSERSKVANVIADHRRAAIVVGGAGLLLWAGASGVGAVLGGGSEAEQSQPPTSTLPTTEVTVAGTPTTILDTPPEATTIAINPASEGYFQATPSGKPCELYFPFNDEAHVVQNVRLVQGALGDLAVETGDPALDPGPADGDQGTKTNGVLSYWRTQYLGVPEGQVMNLAQCDALPALTDGRLDTPVDVPR